MSINQLINQQLDHMVVTGTWSTMVRGYLKPNQNYTLAAEWEAMEKNMGEDFKIPEKEVATPDQDPVQTPSLDSRTVADRFFTGQAPVHQHFGYAKMVMGMYTRFTEKNRNDLHTAFTKTTLEAAEWIADKGGITADLQSRRALTQAYLGGNSYVTTLSASPVTTLALKDTNGFKTKYVLGVPMPVSVTYPLAVTITNATLGTITRNVTGCTPGTRNDADDTIPGTITISVAVAEIAVGDNVRSSQCPPHLAPNGKSSPYDIDADDTIDFQTAMSIMALLGGHGNKGVYGNHFLFIGDFQHQAQFWADPDFRDLYTGQYGSSELKEGAPVTAGNTTYLFSNRPPVSVNESGVPVRRAVILGKGALVRGYWDKDPSESYGTADSRYDETYDAKNRFKTIIQKPNDNLGLIYTFSYLAYWGFCARTAHLAQFGEYPDAPHKFGVGLFSA